MPRSSIVRKLNYELPVLKLCLVKESPGRKTVSIHTPADAARYLRPLSMACEEHFVSVHLNSKNQVIGVHEVSHGTLSTSLVHPREVFKAAIMANSYAILVSHNHPSGAVLEPSDEDIATTRQLVEAGNIMGVNVIDHMIIGPGFDDDWYSLRENLPHLWPRPCSPDSTAGGINKCSK